MDIEEIKRRLDSLDERLGRLENKSDMRVDIAGIERGSIQSAQERLVRRYRMFALIGLLMCPVVGILYRNIMPLLPRVMFAGFFLVASMMDFYLWKGVKSINCSTMGVATVAEKARFYRKMHHVFMAVLVVLMVPVLGTLVRAFAGDEYMIWGMVAGGVLGFAIGVRMYLNMMREYRTLNGLRQE